MLGYQENLSTTSVDHNQVRIWVLLSQNPNIFFYSEDLVKSFAGNKFIQKNDLSAILDHAMAGKAW